MCLPYGTTTMLDAGGSGWKTFDSMRDKVITKSVTRVFSLLNIVGSSNAKDKSVLWKFINKFHQNITPKDHPILDNLTLYAINYFKDKVEPIKNFKKPNLEEKAALKNLVAHLENVNQNFKPEDIQTIVYSVGKDNGYDTKLRDWFKLIYEVLFGEEDGPRMGFFISFFGVKETINLINDKIK